ncbi:hypothetical protein F4804DRAFT_344383 [Jackrogersella minutella]|nr:hypothetical protein F4804DRAFT_344383 [Jackrogersella minutella]
MDASNTYPPLLIRRNGRPQACDPCHKRKQACDHTRPVCQRCRKRKQDAECVYVMSGSRAPGPRSPLPTPTPSMPRSAGARRHAGSSQTTPAVTPDIQAPRLAQPGYLGPTSYCDIYEDTENSLSLLQGSDNATTQSENISQHAPIERAQNLMSPRVREMCLTVLRSMPHGSRDDVLRFKKGSDGWLRPIAQRGLKSLYATFGHYLVQDCTSAKLEELARIICANTLKPFSDDQSDSGLWTSQFMGENTRWELIGLLSIFLVFVPGEDAAAVWKGKRSAEFDRTFHVQRENLRLCFELCKEFSTGNSLMLYLSHRCVVIDSRIVGDADLLVWRSHADSISLLTFLGYHAMENKARHSESVTSEVKKRIFHHMFTIAMVIVSFTGRPPLLASRYSSTPLPLDISDDDLFSDSATFTKAVSRLDERGWNTDGKIYCASRIRARAILAVIREELFEIALANDQVAPIETLLKLQARELQTVSDFPVHLHYNPRDLEDMNFPIEILSVRMFVQLEHLQNMFFIERLLLRNGHDDRGDLLKVSYDLVVLTLPWMAPFRSDCEWLVMAYAVPAGGILCLELLKPTLHIRPHSDPRITRSNIIQKLTLLVAYLEWVSPSGLGPNGDMCSDAKSVIQRVLDQTLNAASSVYEPPAVFEWDSSTQLDFNFDLLDTFDWNRPDFPSSQQSNQ